MRIPRTAIAGAAIVLSVGITASAAIAASLEPDGVSLRADLPGGGVLVGLGATSLSMAPTALADVRATLLQHSIDDARVIAQAALAANDAASARDAARAAAAQNSTVAV